MVLNDHIICIPFSNRTVLLEQRRLKNEHLAKLAPGAMEYLPHAPLIDHRLFIHPML
ncbi:hypothetical protein OIV19_21875 [Brucella sp. HL-2]|nr:hypothetical protein [Brucella sp. HL-2]MCV9910245.1 hypothetical protein [Brucella sp. HL-2]